MKIYVKALKFREIERATSSRNNGIAERFMKRVISLLPHVTYHTPLQNYVQKFLKYLY